MSAQRISMREWLQHATPNNPLHVLRDEARRLVEDAVRFEDLLAEVRRESDELNRLWAESELEHCYDADEDVWA